MSKSTTTLSVRVPVETAKFVEDICKQRGIAKNTLLKECIHGQGQAPIQHFADGGAVMPEAISDLLCVLGTIGTGALVYNVIHKALPKDVKDEDRELLAIVGALAGGLLMGYGLDRMRKKG